MASEFIYYANRKGAADYMEEVVLEMKRPLTEEEQARLEKALADQDMVFVRVWEFKGEAPDFTGTVQI